MCNCNKDDHKNIKMSEDVPNFAIVGFEPMQLQQSDLSSKIPDDVLALEFKTCVRAFLDNDQICFDMPYFGKQCIRPPIPLPKIEGMLSACVQSCGRLIPTGAQVSIYYNDQKLFSYSIGIC